MKKRIIMFMFAAVVTGIGCRSMQEKNLSTFDNIMAAEFNIAKSDVVNLQSKGFTEEEIIKILIISKSSYYDIEGILLKTNHETDLEEIGVEVGIEEKVLNEKSAAIREKVSRYLSEQHSQD